MAAAIGVAALPVVGSAVFASTSETRWVDDDGAAGVSGCDGTELAYMMVQAAVDASDGDDRVLVCPGRYIGQVHISGLRDGLTLRSIVRWQAVLVTPPELARPLGFGFLILIENVDDVAIRGFRLLARTIAPCETPDVLLGAVGSLRTAVVNDHFFAQADDASGAACGYGLAVALTDAITDGQAGGGTTDSRGSMFAAHNLMRDFRVAGFGAFGGNGRLDVEVVRNIARFDHGARPATMPTGMRHFTGGGIAPTAASDGQVDGDGQAGMLVQGRVGGTLRGNTIEGPPVWRSPEPPSYGLFSGIYVAADPAVTNFPLRIRGNQVSRVTYGLAIQDGSDVDLVDNAVWKTRLGLAMDGTVASRVVGNAIGGIDAAIFVGSSSVGNSFIDNVASPGGCVDESVGTGTSSTGNDWVGNVGPSSSPEGLCSQP